MNIQDVLAKIKPLQLAKELKRTLAELHELGVKIRGTLAPRLRQTRKWMAAALRKSAAKIRRAKDSWPRLRQPGELVRKLERLLANARTGLAGINFANLLPLAQLHKRTLAMAGGGLVACWLLLWTIWPSPVNPYSAFEEARKALHDARQVEARTYTPKLLQMAESRWERARISWHLENQRWRIRRDYTGVVDSVNIATRIARQASTQAIAIRDSLHWLSATGITLVKDKIDSFKAQFSQVPVQATLRKKFLAGELAIFESELAFHRRDYFRALTKYQQAAADVGSADQQASKAMQAYLANLPKWRTWAEETVAWSQQEQDIAIVVDKMAANVQIYKSGVLHAEYPVELGPRWVGHKRHRGDGATPEGRYRVIRKKDGNRTIYHKALEINYPNETDQEAFRLAVARGELPRGTHIGGLIEIHGEGGRGANWTAGCVALRNPDMEAIFEISKVGTPVTIVGSLKGLPARVLNMNGVANSLNGTVSRKKS
ncbi:MAG: L,D-transpeptidase family protein [bacterium]